VLVALSIASNDHVELLEVINMVFEDPGSNAVLKPVIETLAEAINDMSSNSALVAVGNHCVLRLGPRMYPGIERADFLIRWALFTVHVADEDWLRAATVLAGSRVDSESLSEEEKVRLFSEELKAVCVLMVAVVILLLRLKPHTHSESYYM
jgi:hypothetical protein